MIDLSNCIDKYLIIDDFRFTLDEKTGYYRCNKIRRRLHQYIWEKYKGPIPKGYHIHHIDHNKKNNHIDNLVAISHGEHASYHEKDKQNEEEYLDWKKENLIKKAIPEAVKWHKSKVGREWHKSKAIEEAKNREHEKFTCTHCEEVFEAWSNGKNRFCSDKCKSAWRRKQGLDNEIRICEYCKVEFEVNKYSKKRFCSRTCSNKAIPRLPQYKQ